MNFLIELRCMLRKLERDVGLEKLTPAELNVFLAAYDLSGLSCEKMTSDQIRRHHFVSGLAQSTFYRALRSLVRSGWIEVANGCRSKHYVFRGERFID